MFGIELTMQLWIQGRIHDFLVGGGVMVIIYVKCPIWNSVGSGGARWQENDSEQFWKQL